MGAFSLTNYVSGIFLLLKLFTIFGVKLPNMKFLLALIFISGVATGQKEISSTYIDDIFGDTVLTTKEQMFRVKGTSYLLTIFLQKINSNFYLNIVDVESQFNFQTANTTDKVGIKLSNGELIKLKPDRVTTSKKINIKNYQLSLRCKVSKTELSSLKSIGILAFYISVDYDRFDFEIPESYKFDLNPHIDELLK